MNVGVVVHGPEVIDSGKAVLFLDWLEARALTRAVLGGTMGRVAVLDAGLEHLIDISSRKAPSSAVLDMRSSDIVVLLSKSKNRSTGLVLGGIVAARAQAVRSLVHVDFGGGFVADWIGGSDLSGLISRDFGLDHLLPSPSLPRIRIDGGLVWRELQGAEAGEPVTCNGVVIGRALGGPVEIACRDGRFVKAKGLDIKVHGLEKLPRLDLASATLRSGQVRRSAPSRIGSRTMSSGRGCMVMIDHSAESSFELAAGAELAVTVGDDTTAVASQILGRLGIPFVGIVDGDSDGLCSPGSMPPGTAIIQVDPGHDDLVGKMAKEVLNGCAGMDDLVSRIADLAGVNLVGIRRY
ncbi:MAG: hypothetical protein A4E45_01448 [Methanosaeta sp. PtaB.Bin039]|nr:MAG: hypothetical protein A4E45_01448 [Methanosaeta sp. PtaB.Bin039]OPY46052.1 MAG: hypothetical protein A4E47_00754 [Methanosaeta sp. PtaU1.Bin028]HOT06613.1 DUF2117 domain-containing protein [Methanotrichaceae archaeon]HQF16505.1 DUF2117 domain-containing protein [Methanotrichaceae archaeon]HQI91124.1 DUF2117 domain-containing protein [Methanotrichaceae archaeon]